MKKKILIFVPEFPRLSETFIERDISKLISLGNLDITLLVLAKGTGQTSPNVSEHTVYQRISIKDLFFGFFKFFLIQPVKSLKILSLMTGPDIVPFFFSFKVDQNDLRSETSFLGRFQYSRVVHWIKGHAFAHMFSKFSPQEIHAHFLSDSSNIAMVAAMLLDVPFSISAHAKDVLVEPSLPKLKAQKAKFITICNKNAFEKCKNLAGENSSNIVLNYHGVDVNNLLPTHSTLEKPNKPVIFLGGTRLVEKKGIKYVIEASKLLKQRDIDHVVYVVGPRDPNDSVDRLSELMDLARHLDVLDNVQFLGEGNGLPFSELSQYYLIADIFVSANINAGSGDADGIPNTLIEAALAKLPIVTTNAGSVSEFINEQNGIIVEQKNPKQIADAAEKLFKNPALAAQLGQSAYEKAVEMFDNEGNVKQLEEYLLK